MDQRDLKLEIDFDEKNTVKSIKSLAKTEYTPQILEELADGRYFEYFSG